MKKIIFLLFLFFLIIFVEGRVSFDEEIYGFHTLEFSNLNTKNFNNYFSNIKVIRIYPYINPIYKNRVNFFYDVHGDLGYEINNFRDEYLGIIKKNSYLDYNYLYINGINISRLDVYISNRDLNSILKSDLSVNVVK